MASVGFGWNDGPCKVVKALGKARIPELIAKLTTRKTLRLQQEAEMDLKNPCCFNDGFTIKYQEESFKEG